MKLTEKLKEFAKQIQQNAGNPSQLAELNVKLSSHYAYHTSLYIESKLEYADYYKGHKVKDEKGKYPSDKFLDQLWLTTEKGQNYYELKRGLRAFEKLLDSTKSAVYTANLEAKNQI